MIADIKNVIPLIQDSEMMEPAGQVLGKLETISDEEFAEAGMNTLEILTPLLVIFATLTYLDNKNNRK